MSKSLERMIADERKRIQAKILELVAEDKRLEEAEALLIKPKSPATFKDMMAHTIEVVGEKE